MNLYFIFKKVRSVDANKMMETLLKEEEFKDRNSEETLKEIEEMVEANAELEQPMVTKRRLVLKKPAAAAAAPQEQTVMEGPRFKAEKIVSKTRMYISTVKP